VADTNLALFAGGIALTALGLWGVVLPGLPGAWLMVVGLALVAAADGFMRVSVPTLVIVGAIGIASYGIDVMAAGIGTRRVGASPRAMLGATLGTLAGFFFGLPGLVAGPFVGAVLGELSVKRDIRRAGRAGVAAWIGFVVGMAFKVGAAAAMIAVFTAAWLF
jgi:uncharacterized protein YqgC (DUF456 family)